MLAPAGGLPLITQHWDEHLEWMRQNWQPGQHIASIGPTGEGKTTYTVGLLGIRKYPLALDPKGRDETLSASGWVRVEHLDPGCRWWQLGCRLGWWMSEDRGKWRDIWEAIDAGQPARVIVGGDARSDDEDQALIRLMADAIRFARHSRGWTLYVDEFELLSSQRMYRLGPPVERMLIAARSARTSVVTSFQAPAWVSRHATRQARYVVMYPTGARDVIRTVAESMGRDWRQLAEAVDELPQFFCLVIPRGNRRPMMLVNAPRLGQGRPAAADGRRQYQAAA